MLNLWLQIKMQRFHQSLELLKENLLMDRHVQNNNENHDNDNDNYNDDNNNINHTNKILLNRVGKDNYNPLML